MEIKTALITHYFARIGVAVVSLKRELKVGDTIHILGHTSDFTQKVASMEIDHHKVQSAGPGDDVALKVTEPVRENDVVYTVAEENAGK
jgi:translation elongation factor EF-1alpha